MASGSVSLAMDVSGSSPGVMNADGYPATGVQILPALINDAEVIFTWFRSPTHIIAPVAGENFKCEMYNSVRGKPALAEQIQIAKNSDSFLWIQMSPWHIAKNSRD